MAKKLRKVKIPLALRVIDSAVIIANKYMNKVKVLIEGYAKINKDGTWEATSTTTLIEHGNIKIIMDPGCDRKLLNENLASNNLGLEDIVWVFLSHRHLDNTVLIGIFPNAKVIDDELFQDGPHGELHKTFIPGTDIEIVKTPGHSPRHGSLLVNTSDGVVAVAVDVLTSTLPLSSI